MNWERIHIKEPKNIYEVAGASDEPLDIYRQRYTSPPPDYYEDKIYRYYENVLQYVDYASSVLVFGSGHPYIMNKFKDICFNIGKMGCVDFIVEAGNGLYKDIDYYNVDILKDNLPTGYDYIFSSHTLEHFTRDQLLNTVMPRLMHASREGVIAVVPYGEAWKDEPSHKCRFYEDDELAAMASKYKKILDGQELVLWFQKGE